MEAMSQLLCISTILIDCGDCEAQPPDSAALQLEALRTLLSILGDAPDHVRVDYSLFLPLLLDLKRENASFQIPGSSICSC